MSKSRGHSVGHAAHRYQSEPWQTWGIAGMATSRQLFSLLLRQDRIIETRHMRIRQAAPCLHFSNSIVIPLPGACGGLVSGRYTRCLGIPLPTPRETAVAGEFRAALWKPKAEMRPRRRDQGKPLPAARRALRGQPGSALAFLCAPAASRSPSPALSSGRGAGRPRPPARTGPPSTARAALGEWGRLFLPPPPRCHTVILG